MNYKYSTFKVTEEQVQRMIELRQLKKSIKYISKELDIKEGTIKDNLLKRGITVSKEVHYKNNQEAKAAKNPAYLEDMRNARTPESYKKAKASIQAYWDTHPEARISNGEKTKENWTNYTAEQRAKILVPLSRGCRKTRPNYRGLDSVNVTRALEHNGVSSMQELLEFRVERRGGELLSSYEATNRKVKVRCDKEHEFYITPNGVQQGHWCLKCAASAKVSKAEIEIRDYAISLVGLENVMSNDREVLDGDSKGKELDIYLPNHKFSIEYNGLRYHSTSMPGRYDRLRSRDKALSCHRQGISHFMIYEDEWIRKRELVKSMIRIRVGKFEGIKLNARSLVLKKLNKNKEFNWFFELNHLDGHSNSMFAYGLFFNDKLVMCVSVRKTSYKNNEYEIARMATDYEYRINGGASRLIKAISRDLGDVRLITYSNNRLSSGNVYIQLGAVEITESTSPSYFYVNLGKKIRYFRTKCRRLTVDKFPGILEQYPHIPQTEIDQCHSGLMSYIRFGVWRPLYRIDDCGHKKWLLNPGSGYVTVR